MPRPHPGGAQNEGLFLRFVSWLTPWGGQDLRVASGCSGAALSWWLIGRDHSSRLIYIHEQDFQEPAGFSARC